MDELVVPNLPAGCRIETDETLAIEAVAGTMAAVVVVGRRADRQVNITEFLVGAHRRPDVGVAGFLPGLFLPGLDPGLAFLRHGMEGPEQPAGDDIEASD